MEHSLRGGACIQCHQFSCQGECQRQASRLGERERRKPLIIGFGHKAQNGKDSAVAHIIKAFGIRPEGEFGKYFPMDIRRYSFADALKIEVFDWIQATAFLESKFDFGVLDYNFGNVGGFYFDRPYSNKEKLEIIDKNKSIPEVRHLLQIWGTEFRRKQKGTYWVDQTLDQIRKDGPQVALLSDMRFLNETEICDATVNVRRTGFADIAGKHASEQELESFNYQYILEAKDLPELYQGVETLFPEILEDKGLLPRGL